jgi:hypothetical protein
METVPQNLIKSAFGLADEEQSATIAEKYQELRSIVIEHYDELCWFKTDAALAVHASMLLDTTTNPIGLIFVDAPATGKTTVLDFFEGLIMNRLVDKFTPASFLSHASNVRKPDLKNVDLLPKIVYKTMMVPEMAPIFNMPKEMLLENYGILARVMDGRGLSFSGGVHGQRELVGDYLFNILGASTPLAQLAWNTMGKLGSRLMFLHAPAQLSCQDRMMRAKSILAPKSHYRTMKRKVQNAVCDFVRFFFKQFDQQNYIPPDDAPEHLRSHEAVMEHCGYLPRVVSWDVLRDDDEVIEIMSTLAEFTTAARSENRFWVERDHDGRMEISNTSTALEGVDRFAALLGILARSHALVSGRSAIGREELPLIINVALSSIPDNRKTAIELLVEGNREHKDSPVGEFTTTELTRARSCNDKTAAAVMKELESLSIGSYQKGFGQSCSSFQLADDYSWLLTNEFRQYYRPWIQSK